MGRRRGTWSGPTDPVLPPDLAPARRAEVEALLSEVPLASPPPNVVNPRRPPKRNTCHLCDLPGKLATIRLEDGRDVFIHRSCRHRLNHSIPRNPKGIPRP